MKASRLSNLNAYWESSIYDTCVLDGVGRGSEEQASSSTLDPRCGASYPMKRKHSRREFHQMLILIIHLTIRHLFRIQNKGECFVYNTSYKSIYHLTFIFMN